MAAIDDYLDAMVRPHLRPHETITGRGHLRRHMGLSRPVMEAYDDWLATVTDQRLILFRTEVDGATQWTPRAQCLEVREWRFAELQSVGREVNALLLDRAVLTSMGTKFLVLVPRDGLGPYEGEAQRYDLIPRTLAFDGHMAFYGGFAEWIEQAVSSGRHPLDAEAHAKQQAVYAQRRVRAAEDARVSAARGVQNRQALSAVWPFLAALVPLGLAGLFGLIFSNETTRVGYAVDGASVQRKELAIARADAASWVRAGTEPPQDCPEKLTKSRLALSGVCHGCVTMPYAPGPRPGTKVYPRGDLWWVCDGPDAYAARIAHIERRIAEQEESADRPDRWAWLALTLLAGMVAFGVFAWAAVRSRKLSAAPAAPVGGGGAPHPQG